MLQTRKHQARSDTNRSLLIELLLMLLSALSALSRFLKRWNLVLESKRSFFGVAALSTESLLHEREGELPSPQTVSKSPFSLKQNWGWREGGMKYRVVQK